MCAINTDQEVLDVHIVATLDVMLLSLPDQYSCLQAQGVLGSETLQGFRVVEEGVRKRQQGC